MGWWDRGAAEAPRVTFSSSATVSSGTYEALITGLPEMASHKEACSEVPL